MRRLMLVVVAIVTVACAPREKPGDYLFVWTGDSAGTTSDFLAVIDANPASANYGSVISTLPTGEKGTHPHHTEGEMPADNHLLANGFHSGRTWLFDLSAPRAPKILTTFDGLAGFDHPHSYLRLPDGHVLATFQYATDSMTPMVMTSHEGMAMGGIHATGGLVEMDERGTVVRSASGRDSTISDQRIFPYSVLPMASIDRAVSTTSDMDSDDSVATSQWVQLWRLSDLKLLKSIPLGPGPRGTEQKWTGEPRLLPDGKSVYIHTFACGLYLLRGIDTPEPSASFVMSFKGEGCGVPLVASHYWLQPVPDSHSLVSLDISDPEHPREVSSVGFGDDEMPHWIAIDATGKRVALNSGGSKGNRLFIVNFDPVTGMLAIDEKFRDAGATVPGVRFTGKSWPHGFSGTAVPHGTVFSR